MTRIELGPVKRKGKLSPSYILVCLLALGLCSCAVVSIDTMRNEPLPPKKADVVKTRASQNLTVAELPNGVFIGISMSGGGSRATNFSAAVLLELEKLGILQKTAVISSVSGSSLVAAYYGLYGNTGLWKDVMQLRSSFRTDFESPWLWSWLDPRNFMRYWFTNFNRSDMMRQVLDNELFDEKQFKDMGAVSPEILGRPQILINATSDDTGRQFVYSDEQFAHGLNSRLDTYPVANAVMASSAFPGVFQNITLKDYRIKGGEFSRDELGGETQNYGHLFDGGPSDNLGVKPLVEIIDNLYQSGDPQKQPKGCFLFVADAYPYQESLNHLQKMDTRSWYDYIFSTNLISASDTQLSTHRTDMMKELGVDTTFNHLQPYVQEKRAGDSKNPVNGKLSNCNIWHLTFQRMYEPSFETIIGPDGIDLLRNVRKVVTGTPTRYKLTEVQGYSPETVQDYLFKAANILVKNDKVKDEYGNEVFIFQDVCKKMTVLGLKDLKCD